MLTATYTFKSSEKNEKTNFFLSTFFMCQTQLLYLLNNNFQSSVNKLFKMRFMETTFCVKEISK